MVKTKPTSTSPIVDTNGDGKLDSKELLAQLSAEEVKGQERDASEKVHAVLDASGLRDLNGIINKAIMDGEANWTKQEVADEIETRIKGAVENILQLKKKHPDLKGFMEETFKKMGLTGDTLVLNVSDMNNMIDFAENYKTTFPKGVEIAADDAPTLLSHFGRLLQVVEKSNGR